MEITVKIPYIDKVVDHVKKHKTIYISGGVVVIAGITYAIMRSKPRPLWRGVEPTSVVKSANTASFVFGNKASLNNVSFIVSQRQGPPSWIIHCLETGETFLSQRAAAFAKGLSEGDLSDHLNHKTDLINDLHFERLGLAL